MLVRLSRAKRKRGWLAPTSRCFPNQRIIGLIVHAAHARAVTAAARSWFFLLRNFGDEAFGRQQQTCNRGRVLQRRASDLLGIDYTSLHQVFVFASGDIVAFITFAALDFL